MLEQWGVNQKFEMMERTYILPLSVAPSLNTIMRMHYHKKATIKKEVVRLLWEQDAHLHKFKGEVSFTFTRKSVRLMDWDNHCASMKFILDALVDMNVIKEDNPKVIKSFNPLQEKVGKKKEQLIKIKIREL